MNVRPCRWWLVTIVMLAAMVGCSPAATVPSNHVTAGDCAAVAYGHPG